MIMSKRTILCVSLSVMIVGFSFQPSHGGEQIGNLIFDTVRKIEERQRDYMGEVTKVRSERKALLKQRDAVKAKYLKVPADSLAQKEAHAEYSYVMAQVLKNNFEDIRLVRAVSADHLKSLSTLKDSLKNGSLQGDAAYTGRIVENTKGLFKSSASLMNSLAAHADAIQDPEIHRRLSAARNSAKLLETYIAKLDSSSQGIMSAERFREEIVELEQGLTEVYLQTGVMLDMARSQADILKMANQLAMSDLVLHRLSQAQDRLGSLSGVIEPLKDVIIQGDEDLEILGQGLFKNGSGKGRSVDKSWTQGW